jgi:iron complex outermembrane receptor protein
MRMHNLILIFGFTVPGFSILADEGSEGDERHQRFMQMSLEELMSVEVTSVAGVGKEWFTTPAAMYVIEGEDIRRTGHRSIAEALRLVPGVHVGRITANQWAISTRGFNSRFANKQLVLIDGRTVYDPLFGACFGMCRMCCWRIWIASR